MNNKPQNWKFEDIQIGYKTELAVFFVTDEDMKKFSEISGDANLLHMDDAFAKGKGFKGRVVYGMLLASKFSYIVGMLMPGQDALYLTQDLVFKNPAYIGEQLTVFGEVLGKSESTRSIELRLQILNESNRVVVEGTARIKLL